MANWAELGAQVARKSQRLEAAERDRLAREQARIAAQLWANRAAELVMTQLFELLSEQVAAFAQSTGVELSLRAPRRVLAADQDAQRLVLSLGLRDDNVDLYAQWAPGSPPSVHLLLSRTRRGRALRLICIPGAWLSPGNGGAVDLHAFDDSAVVTVESLAFRAVSLLAME